MPYFVENGIYANIPFVYYKTLIHISLYGFDFLHS